MEDPVRQQRVHGNARLTDQSKKRPQLSVVDWQAADDSTSLCGQRVSQLLTNATNATNATNGSPAGEVPRDQLTRSPRKQLTLTITPDFMPRAAGR